jgi:hypothetical protein
MSVFSEKTRTALEATQPHIQLVTGNLSEGWGVRWRSGARGAQIPRSRSPGRPTLLQWRLISVDSNTEVASCHPSAAKNFDMTSRFLRTLFTSAWSCTSIPYTFSWCTKGHPYLYFIRALIPVPFFHHKFHICSGKSDTKTRFSVNTSVLP